MRSLVGYRHGRRRGQQRLRAAGVGPEDIQVVELHDCFTTNELLTYEALGLTPDRHRGEVHPRRRQHLRRPGRDQPVRRPAVQGPSAGRDRARPVRRTGLAAARAGPGPAGRGRRSSRCSTTSASAAPASSRCTRRWTTDGPRPVVDRPRAARRIVAAVTRSRLRDFAKATGQSDPVYTDVDAAKQAGHRDLPVPPTFFFGIELEAPEPFAFLNEPRCRPAHRAARRTAVRPTARWPMPVTN